MNLKFRMKPVVIEAFQVPPDDDMTRPLPPMWLVSAMACRPPSVLPSEGGGLSIQTLEGVMRADVGDWIIQGVMGELYPCKPDIFAATYEAA